uniref:Uncharacterized protein n=1 Tax=Anguilla anguilla TaxID=7936 RepID=A0A0E9U0J9_ANGAN
MISVLLVMCHKTHHHHSPWFP